MQNSDLIKFYMPSCISFFEGTFVLTSLFLLLYLSYSLVNWIQYQILQTSVYELKGLWQLIQVNARISNESPVVFWLQSSLLRCLRTC